MYVGVILYMPSPLHQLAVFPMYVGVILIVLRPVPGNGCIPHVCGGDPQSLAVSGLPFLYSPCMWG